MIKRVLKIFTAVVFLVVGANCYAQTPNNCGAYTSTGTTGSGTTADDCGVPCMVPGQSGAAWTGTGCTGFITSTVVGGPVSCLTLAYVAVNQNDYGTITTDTGGTLTITAVNAAVVGNVVGPYDCPGSWVGTVEITVSSTIPFNSVTLTNSGCSSGWVINCASQANCGGGSAGADSTTTVCGGTLDLNNLMTGSAGGTWSETTSSGQFNTTTAVFDAGAAGVGTYTFEYQTVGGACSGADTAFFTVNVVNPASATWNPPVGTCQNDPDIDLNALVTGTPGGTWSGTGVTGNMFDPSVGTQTITYTVGTSPCDDVSAQSINITPAMDPTWVSPDTICEAAGTINLDALITGDPGGTWSGTGVTGSNFDPTGLSGAINVTYTVGSAPCIGVDMQVIFVEPDVDPSWTPPTTLCDDSPLFDLNTVLTGTSGGTWSGTGVTGSNFDPSVGTQSITYDVGGGACVETSTQSITVGVAPDPTWTTLTLCVSDAPVDLSAQVTGTAGGTFSGTGVSSNIFDPSVGTQAVTYTITSGNCTASSVQSITVLDPTILMSGTNVSCFGLMDGDATATVTGTSGSETYIWNPSGQSSASATGLSAGMHVVTVTDGSCVVMDSIEIIEPAEITATLDAVDGCYPNLGVATINPSGGAGGFTYAWTPSGQTTQSALQLDSAMHTVVVTDANGCTYTDSALIVINTPPVVTVTNDTTLVLGEFIQLNASGADSYEWIPDADLSCNNCPNPISTATMDTYYCVTGTDANGCTDEACMTLSIEIVCGEVFVPSGFSPNDDSENDNLCVYSDCIETMVFTVFNRWGEKVFESSSMQICWDGTWNGKPLNSGVFVYTLDAHLINGQNVLQKGNISLIR